MADYDLGTARGKVVVDYKDHGAKAASNALDYLKNVAGRTSNQLKELNASAKDTKVGFAHIEDGAHGAEQAIKGLAGAMVVLDDVMNVMDRRVAGFGKVFGNHMFDTSRAMGDLSIALRGVPKQLDFLPREVKNFIRFNGAVGSAIFGVNMLTKRTKTLSRALSIGGRLKGVERGIMGAGAALLATGSAIDRIGDKRPILGAFTKGFIDMGRGAHTASSRVINLALGMTSLMSAGASLVKLELLERRISRFVGKAFMAVGAGVALIQPIVSMASTAILGAWDALKQLSGVAYLLPAAIFSLGVPLAAAIIGFQGMGDAMKLAFADGKDSAKAFEEGIKKLPKSAADLARTVRDIAPAWKEVQKGVQGRLFEGSAEGLRKLSENYLPVMKVALAEVAGGLNDIGGGFKDFANQPRSIAAIAEGMGLVSLMLRNVGDSFTPFLEGMREVGLIGTRHLEKYSKGLEGAAQKFSDFANTQVGADKIDGWITNSIKGFKDLGTATWDLGKGLGNILKPFAGGDYDNALHQLADMTKRFAAFTDESGAGGKALKAFAGGLKKMAGPWAKTFGKIWDQIGPNIEKIAPTFLRVSEIMAKGIGMFASVLGPLLGMLASLFNIMGPGMASMALGMMAARMGLKGLKGAWQVIKPIMATVSGIAAVSRAAGGASGALRIFANSFDKVAAKQAKAASGGNAFQKALGKTNDRIQTFVRAAEASGRQTKNAAGGIRNAAQSLRFLGAQGGTATERIRGLSSAMAESANYAKKANPQLNSLGVMSKIIGANMTAAGQAIRGAGNQIQSSGQQIKSAGVGLVTYRQAAEQAAKAAIPMRGASYSVAGSGNIISRAWAGMGREVAFQGGRIADTSTRIGTASGNAAKTIKSTFVGNMRQLGGEFRTIGSHAKAVTQNMAAMPGAFRQSMVYAKQAAPQMSTFGRAAKVVGINFGTAAAGAKSFNKAAVGMSSAVGAGMTGALGGARSAASGLLGVLGGGWGVAFMAASAAVADLAYQSKTLSKANKDISTASNEAVKSQKNLQVALAMKGGKSSAESIAAGQEMVQKQLDKTAASATKATGIMQGGAKRANNVLGLSYEDMAAKADKASGAFNKNGWEGQMAAKRQQALGDALDATGMTMDEAVKAFAAGGPELDRLRAALTSTGGAGAAVIAEMSGVKASIDGTSDSIGNMGPQAAALSAALSIVTDSAASAEDRLNALRVALQAMGLMETSAFDSAQDVAESINSIADAAAGVVTETDKMGNAFLTAANQLNPLHAGAGQVQDELSALREKLLAADPTEAMGLFEASVPGLQMMGRELGLLGPVWDGILTKMGLTPTSIETQVRMQGMEPTEAALFAVNEQMKTLDGKAVNVEVSALTHAARDALIGLGYDVQWIDEMTGSATITANTDEAAFNLAGFTAKILAVNDLRAEGKLDVETYKVAAGVNETAAAIASVNGFYGEGLLDVNDSSVPPKVGATQDIIESIDSAFGMGRVDVDTSAVGPKVTAAQMIINGVVGKSVYIDIITRNLGAMPAGAGNLDAAAGGATGGRFKGDSFNYLPGYAKGKRHKGYQLPRTGPGTEKEDGFLAFDSLGLPAAWLDKEEWVINGKSSKKWSRLLSAINRDDPRLKALPAFAEGMSNIGGQARGIRDQAVQVSKTVERSTHIITQEVAVKLNEAEFNKVADYLAQISSEEFAQKFGKGAADGLTLGSRDYFVEQGKQYAEALGLVFGKAAEEANDRLKEEIDKIEDKNLKEQREKTLKSTEELQAIADAEMMAWVNNNQFEAMGYTMAKSFADGVSGGQNLVSAGVDALGTAATMALSAAGAPGIVAGLAVQAIKGLVDAFSDPALWDDGILPGVFKIIDSMLGGLVTMVMDVVRNLFMMIGLDLAKVPIIGHLFQIKDAANGASKEVDKLMSDLEALNKLEYKNLGKTGATSIDGAIEAQLGNRALASQVAPAAASGPSGPSIGVLNVSAPDDKASSIIEAATFQMKRY